MEKDFEITVEPVYGNDDALRVNIKYLKNNHYTYVMTEVFIRSTLDHTIEKFATNARSIINQLSGSCGRYGWAIKMDDEDQSDADVYYEVIKSMSDVEFVELLKPSLIIPISKIFSRKTITQDN
jgi:hypothetical protein